MKIALLIAAILVALSSIPLFAQQSGAATHQLAPAAAARTDVTTSSTGYINSATPLNTPR